MLTIAPDPSTIFALSSGAPPAGIAVIRISGPQAGAALVTLAGGLPAPRRATLRALTMPGTDELLDRALLLWFPGPHSATGEDLAEIHAHGGRAVVQAIERARGCIDGLRRAEPGEFTRRALLNGRIDLTEAEGLADLLSAETDSQRRAALVLSGGALSPYVADWQRRLLHQAAAIEVLLDFADEDDVATASAADVAALQAVQRELAALAAEWRDWLARPGVERLRDGLLVAIGGPPNAGKSTLINALVRREAAIVSPTAGTTRDVIEAAFALGGYAFRLADTAGLRDDSDDSVEAMGIDRARRVIDASDILLWLGRRADAPAHAALVCIAAQADRSASIADWAARSAEADLSLSAVTGDNLDELERRLIAMAAAMMPRISEAVLNERHRAHIADALAALDAVPDDPLLLAEHVRGARAAIDRITGAASTEAMLDALFGRFCIGK